VAEPLHNRGLPSFVAIATAIAAAIAIARAAAIARGDLPKVGGDLPKVILGMVKVFVRGAP